MNSGTALLPTEISAIVHHIELNRSGWWEKVVHRLVLSAVWLSGHNPDVSQITSFLVGQFSLPLETSRIEGALRELVKQKALVQLLDGTYRIPDGQRTDLEAEIKALESIESSAHDFFFQLASHHCPGIDPLMAWDSFQSKLLTPLIGNLGANAYHLLVGDGLKVDADLTKPFLADFGKEAHEGLQGLATNFLDPRNEFVRKYVSQLLHARFCVEACGLPDSVIRKLNATVGQRTKFRIFVDTNFLFSLLELHENPSNASARELLKLLKHLGQNPAVQLYITPRTVEEARATIQSAIDHLSGLPTSSNFISATSALRFSGIAQRFISECQHRGGKLDVEEWFGPFLNNPVLMARSKGVELFNEKLDAYSTRQDVVDDILSVRDYELQLPENKRKSYRKVEHDMVLWHLVKDRRPAYVESPLDARDWILTLDYRLIGFDAHKLHGNCAGVPVCLHPVSLVQLLQFWVPRSAEFEEAMLGSLRLPFAFQAFDVEAERVSLRILKRLGRFDGHDHMSPETITSIVLNDELRARLLAEPADDEKAEIALVRDAFIEELKTKATTEAQKAVGLQEIVKQQEVSLGVADTRDRLKEEAIKELTTRIARDEVQAKETAERLAAQTAELAQLRADLARIEERNRQSRALVRYLLCLLVVIAAAGILGWQAVGIVPHLSEVLGPWLPRILSATLVFVVGHLLLERLARRDKYTTQLWPFKMVRMLRRWLWGYVFLLIVVGVAVNLISNWVQKRMDQEQGTSLNPKADSSVVPKVNSAGPPEQK